MTDQPEPAGKVIRLNAGGTEGKLTTRVGRGSPCACTTGAATS
jgi:hypothetical protein